MRSIQSILLIKLHAIHQENMSMKNIPPHTPHLNSKTGVYRGIHIFLIFGNRISEAYLTCIHNQCFEPKY